MFTREQPLAALLVVIMMVVSAGMIGVVAGDGPTVNESAAQANEDDDITVASFDAPGLAEPGEEVTIAVELVNEGDEKTDVDLTLYTEWDHESGTTTLDPGERTTIDLTGDVPSEPGEYFQWIEINGNFVANWIEVTEEPEDRPALRITAVDIPMTATAEETETVSVTIENRGNTPGTGELIFDTATKGDQLSLDLEPGESETVTMDVEIAQELSQDFFFQLIQPELNDPAAIVDYTTDVDLPALEDVTIEPETLPDLHTEGETGTVEATIHNDGDEEHVFPVRYIFNDHVVDGTDLRISPGESETVSFDIPPDLPVGTWEHGIQIGDQAVTEELIVVDETLGEMIDSYEEEIADLQAELEAKEDEIADLEAELDDADVSIDVSVEPADAATFQVGGEALVSIESDDVDPGAVTIDADGEQYEADGGETTVPLSTAGELDFSVTYGDVTESVSITVQEADDEGDDADDGMPGFGPIAALMAIVGSLAVVRRRRMASP